jgi:hypothetical protein
MHLVVWGNSSPITVRLFLQSSSNNSNYFKPVLYNDNLSNVGQNFSSIHFTSFELNGFPTIESDQDSVLKHLYSEVVLKENVYLFVPNNFLVSFLSSVPNTIFKSCFVDASNFKPFNNDVYFYSTFSQYDEQILNSINDLNFNKSMNRHPYDMTVEEYFGFKSNNSAQTQSKEVSKQNLNSNTQSDTISSSSRRRRRKDAANNDKLVTGVDFRDWLEENKWKQLINSITISRPPTPVVDIDSIGRNNVTVSFFSPFLPHSSDKTFFGFKLALCKSDIKMFLPQHRKTLYASEFPFFSNVKKNKNNYIDAQSCIVYNLTRNNNYDVTQIKLNEKIVEIDDVLFTSSTSLSGSSDMSNQELPPQNIKFFASLKGLVANHSYRLSIIVVYDKSQSCPSYWSQNFSTKPKTAPLLHDQLFSEQALKSSLQDFSSYLKSTNNKIKTTSISLEFRSPIGLFIYTYN